MKFNFDDFDLDSFDTVDFELPDFDLVDNIFCDDDQSRYVRPKKIKHNARFCCYNNARKFANEVKIEKGDRIDALIVGNFILGDFIEAYMTNYNARTEHMIISTLSFSQENVESLRWLMEHGYIKELDLLTSQFFYAQEKGRLIPYTYKRLDFDNRFQLTIANMHSKTVQFETQGGKKIILHGSANLRSNNGIEQFTLEENPDLYDFYFDVFMRMAERYKTINKETQSSNETWKIFEQYANEKAKNKMDT